MAVFTRTDSPFYWMWLEGAPAARARVNTKVTIGTTPATRISQRRLADEIYHAAMADLARQRFNLPLERESRTFREQRAWYAEHVSSTKRGAVREQSMLRTLGRFFDRFELAQIDRDRVREYRTHRREHDGVTAATINREEELLKHLCTLAVPKYLEVNVLARMPKLRVEDTERRIVTDDEERRLLAAAAADPVMTAALLCGLDALMRRGSVARLARAQDHGRYLTLLNAKAGMYKVPVSSRLRQALDALDPDDGPLYFARLGPRVAIEIARRFALLSMAAGVAHGRAADGVTFHHLRHTGASRMLARGADLKTVMRIGGWRNLQTLERYLHPTDAAAFAAVESIAAEPTADGRDARAAVSDGHPEPGRVRRAGG